MLQDRSNLYYRGHHVYKEVRDATIREMVKAALDDREEAKECLYFHFINQDPGNKIKALTTGKQQRESRLVAPV